MMSQVVILISGKQGSGKTTLQKRLVNELSKRPETKVHAINFADTLYEMHNFCLGKLESLGIKRSITKDGVLLQLLGTEWGRNTIYENVWVDTLKGRIGTVMAMEGRSHTRNIFVVGDCRFRNEFFGFPYALRIRLNCPAEDRKKRCSSWRENDQHPSETDLDDIDCFDMSFNTQEEFDSPTHIATMIASQIDKEVWLEKRRREDLF